MVQSRQHTALAVEALGKLRVARQLSRQQLERDKPVELRLARLEDNAHAAVADEFKNLELWKRRGDPPQRRDLAGGRGSGAGVGRHKGSGEDTSGTKPPRRVSRDLCAALGTSVQ